LQRTNHFNGDIVRGSNDRLYIGLLKGLGLLYENDSPTERYFAFLDQSQSRRVYSRTLSETPTTSCLLWSMR